jgi:hypothetical protein
VQYEISHGPPDVGMRLILDDNDELALYLPVDDQSGVLYLNDKRLSGRRTLVFTLVTATQQALTNPEATVRVPDVIIEGGR